MINNEQQPARLVDGGIKKLRVKSDIFCSQVHAHINEKPEDNEKPEINEELKDNEKSKERPVFQVNSQFLKSMINTMVNPISYKDKNGVYLGVSESFARQVMGLPEEELVGSALPEICTKFMERFPERAVVGGRSFRDFCKEWDQSDMDLLKSGECKTHEQEVILADGTRAIFLVNRSTFKDENGMVLGLVTVMQDITELRVSEESLEENEERYRIVTEQTGQLVYDNNLENNKLSLAGAVEEVFGYGVEEIKKFDLNDWIEHIHPEDREYVLEKFMQDRKTGGRARVEYRLRKKGGTYIDVEDTGTYLLNENGIPYRVLGVVKDITEQKLTRKLLEKNEEKYRIVMEQTEQIVYDYDFRSKRGCLEGAVEKITGYLPKDFHDTPQEVWTEYIHPDDLEHTTEELIKARKQGGTYRIEFRFRRKDGTYFCAENNGVCLLDENGEPYKFLGVIKDITERKLARERLETSEEKYRSFTQNFKGIAFQLDKNLVPEFTHGAIEEITGYSEEDFMSGRVWWMDIVYPEDLPHVLKQVMKIKNSPHAYDTEFEYRIKHKDGRIKWVNELYQKIPGKNGRPDKYQGAVYDVTEKKEAEEALAEMKEARIKEIHHRIKNNLQVISSLLDLQAEKFEDEKVREAFRESQSRILSMALIHEELYQEKNTEALNFAVYIQKLSENLFQTYRLDHPGVSLKIDLEENVFLDVDTAVPLGIIINELVSNSLKHAFPGQKKGEIHIRLNKKVKSEIRSDIDEDKGFKDKRFEDKGFEGSGLYVSVSDNGVGIPETVGIETPDTLGLQLVSALVDQLDGELELKKDKGTEFIIRIHATEHS
ncbi:MAG: PAS domain-containing protein [Methanosarcina sp.]